MNNNFEKIKDYLYKRLLDFNQLLTFDQIEKEINELKEIFAAPNGLSILSRIVNAPNLSPLAENEWDKLKLQLERIFNVKMQNSVSLQGFEQQKRDLTWWSGKEKINCMNYYWTRYKNLLKRTLPINIIDVIDNDTDRILDNIGNPALNSFNIKGMVVGHVQFGKTGNYAGLVCKAADAGYKFVVVIAGGTNSLRNQTQKRLNDAFVGYYQGKQVGAGLGETNNEYLPVCLTTAERDFNKNDADKAINLDNVNSPILIVIKKESRTLSNVIRWIRNQYKNKISDHSMIVIDDESDYASINTKEENEPTIINRNIRELLSLFKKNAYVAYTATPYANIFIDHQVNQADLGEDLFPKDFIFCLDSPSNYYGAKKIFIDSGQTIENNKYLVEIKDNEEFIPIKHKKDHIITQLPESLKEAVRLFVLNITIRFMRGQEHKHNSMMIHVSRFTAVHQKISSLVKNYLEKIIIDVNNFCKLSEPETQSDIIIGLRETFKKFLNESEYQWQDILKNLSEKTGTILVREVHDKATIPLEYRDDIATNVIAIGGNSLSRGFTLEGLSISYFIRNTIFFDTLMQMGRWFGYRSEYDDLFKIYLQEEARSRFEEIIEATEDLFDDFRIMSEQNRTPNEFGLAVKRKIESALQITAKNKQKHVEEFILETDLSGNLKETSRLSSKNSDIKNNLNVLQTLLTEIDNNNLKEIGNHKLWIEQKKEIVENFLNNFKVFMKDHMGLSTRMPIAIIKKDIKTETHPWNICLYSGELDTYEYNGIIVKKRKRQLIKKDGYFELPNRQVSSGDEESIAFPEEERRKLGAYRKKIRRRAEELNYPPLLMIHVISPQLLDEQIDDIVAFGISFPTNFTKENNKDKTVRITINKVYYKELLKEYEENEEENE